MSVPITGMSERNEDGMFYGADTESLRRCADVVPSHVCVVDEVIRPSHGSEPSIRLINPWGDVNSHKPQVLELTQSEYSRSFVSHNSHGN